LFYDPVRLADGFNYERWVAETWLKSGHTTSPVTDQALPNTNIEIDEIMKTNLKTFIEE